MTGEPEPPPLLRVVRGEPTDEELAALTVVLAARASVPTTSTPTANSTRSGWRDRSRILAGIPRRGPGAWRASARPS